MHATRKVKLKDLSANLTCNLCGGYFIDATTIIECLHSFCRSCIVQHLEQSEYCPVCEVQLHSSKPLSSIRADKMLQEVVYKLVPGLFQNEMSQRREYYKSHLKGKPRTQQDGGQVFNESYITSDDMIHLSLEFDTADKKLRERTKRYFLCPAAVSIAILKKLIQGKYDLKDTTCIEVMYRERYLPDDFLLMDIAYKYSWSQNGSGPLQLYYRVATVPSSLPPLTSLFQQPISNASRSSLLSQKRKSSISDDRPIPLKGRKLQNGPANLTPNGKKRGRPKRVIPGEDAVGSPAELKKVKLLTTEKAHKKSKLKKIEKVKCSRPEEVPNSVGTEVQLRISENGVISAKSTSGEEKIINPALIDDRHGVPPPSPIGLLKKLTAANENQGSRCLKSPSPIPSKLCAMQEQDMPISLKKSVNGIRMETNRIQAANEAQKPVQVKVSPEKMIQTPPAASPIEAHNTPLKVPAVSKWLHQSNVVNGTLKFTTKASPVKDRLGFTANPPSLPKKPPKFFKSRISESNGSSNAHDESHVSPDESKSSRYSSRVSSTNLVDLKIPGSRPTSPLDRNPAHNHNLQKRQIETTTPSHAEPIPSHHQILNHSHQYQPSSFGLANGNMGTTMSSMELPMQFVSSLANGYCTTPPFFPIPNPYLTSALAMTLNLNHYSPFANYSVPSANASSGSQKATSKIQNGKNSGSLDLTKKSKSSGYVQISPKKVEKGEICNKDKVVSSPPRSHTPTLMTEKNDSSKVQKLPEPPSKSPIKPKSNSGESQKTESVLSIQMEVKTPTTTGDKIHGVTCVDSSHKDLLFSEEPPRVKSSPSESLTTVAEEIEPENSRTSAEGILPVKSPPVESGRASQPSSTVMATLTVSLDETPPAIPHSGKSPSLNNNNNILGSIGTVDPPCSPVNSSVSVNIISSSTSTTTTTTSSA